MSADLALDFGTAFTRVADEHGALLLEEPTRAAIDVDTRSLVAFGAEAAGSVAGSAGRVVAIRPVRAGQLVDLDLGEEVLAEVLRRVGAGRLAHPRVLVATHVGATEVQRRALDRALDRAGARQVRFVETPLACAVGAGIEIEEPDGAMVVDIGAGRTDVGVLALGGIVTSASLPSGGDDFDDALRAHLVRAHGLVVDRQTATSLRERLGSVRPTASAPTSPTARAEVLGRSANTGEVGSAIVSTAELATVLEEVLVPLLDLVVGVLTDTPPELANDLLTRGLLLAGGGAGIDGLDIRLARATGVPVHVAAEGARLTVLGASRCLEQLEALQSAVSPAPRR